MSCGGILKESEIFNEINNSSNEDSCSEIDNEEVGTTLRRVSPRKREVRCKKTQTGHKKTLESDKTKTKTEETRETGGRLTRKRKAQTATSDDTPSKTNRKSQNVNEGEKNKISSKKCVESEDEIDLYNPTTAYSLQRSSAKKNLFTVSDSLTLINSSGSTTPSKQRKNDQNNKENKAQCSNNYKNERTPKKRTSSRVQSFDEFSETESSVKNKLTPVKLGQTPTKQINIGSSSKSERNNRTPRKNLECNLTLKCLEEEVLTNEPSLGIKRLVDLSPSRDNTKSASKPNLDIETEQSSSKTKTPQEAKIERELKRLNIDCNNSLFEATSPVRKNRLSLLKTLTPQKHKVIDENTVKTAKKGLGKEFEKENENEKCLTPNKKENKLLLGVKDTPQSPSVKCEMKTNIRTPLQRQAVTVTTPVSKKKSGRGFLTPSMAKKEHVKEDKTEDDLDATRKQLHISTVPKSLPCRDAEFDQIKSFLVRKIEHSAGGCMYISGVPGTGKTATVHAVIRYLQQQVDSGDLPDFDFVEVNGLRLTEPKQAYVRILQELTGRKLTPDQAQQLLNKRFSSEQNRPTIVLVDELDYLCNRRQDVVYNILDWPSKRGSALVVLTISNTMDLPERTLKGRVTSRMGLTRVTFQPYGFHQLRTIVEDRLSGTETFHPDAVQLVARKVAAVSGDARRALDICRRTTELVERGEQVTASHVQRALEQIFSGPRVAVIQSLCREGQLVLRAIRDVNQRTGVDEAIGTQVYQHLLEICIVDGCPRPTVGHMLQTCVSLVALGLIVAEKGRPDVTRKMSLNVSSDDIHYALDKVHV